MINWVLVQQIVLTILAITMFIVAVVALIRVIPEINKIVNDAMEEDEKNSRDCTHDQTIQGKYFLLHYSKIQSQVPYDIEMLKNGVKGDY